MSPRFLVVDANILVRGAMGVRVRTVIAANAERASLIAPEYVCEEVRRTLDRLIEVRRLVPVDTLEALAEVLEAVHVVGEESYEPWGEEARTRLARRDLNDWPILALALAIDCPIWTEDRDFFGTGVATWTCDLVDRFFAEDELGGV